MKKLFLFALLALGHVQAQAQAETFVFHDERIRSEVYDKNAVYKIDTMPGRATLIEFEKGESLTASPSSILGIGNAKDWDIGVRGSSLAIKPLTWRPETNLLVVTNKRTYAFAVVPAPKNEYATYVLRFTYPDTAKANAEAAHEQEVANALAEARRELLTAASKAEKITINTDYAWRGDDKLLKPTGAFDDGRFTRLIYDRAVGLPVFYNVLPDGSEALLNYTVDPDDRRVVILPEVIRTVRAREGKDVIEIVNQHYVEPKLNMTGTSVYGAVRVDKGDAQ